MATLATHTVSESQRQLAADLTLATSQDIALPRNQPRRTSLRPRASSTTVAIDIAQARPTEAVEVTPGSTSRLAGHLHADAKARSEATQGLTTSGEPLGDAAGRGTPPPHPFANSKSKLELISSENSDGIDVAEEAALYDDLCRTYEDETEQFDSANTPTVASSNAMFRSLTLTSPSKHTSAPPKMHRRRRSSLPPESIFSADIFLADNTNSPASQSWETPPLFASDVAISGWSTVGTTGKTGKGGAGAYVVYDVAITTREGTMMHALKRYTAFEELASKLRKGLPRPLLPFLPPLPPKAPLARFRPAFLETRRRLLQFWLVRVLLHPELGGRREVREWVLA
ncbi:hypothetical protein D9619_013507 [Psilocybe cf. subviscida]|uniref:PX domain-containing protein n=1 Tax=Psilocybe cf. subviscida TaxID=2480587 RepID=A0A8H5BJD9_9AGAR|nr:hypothetical protein D9619_013507 [Psilocybe cf. subviscida]